MSVLIPLQSLSNNYLFTFGYLQKYGRGVKWQLAEYHKTIADTLQKVLDGEITRLIVNIPPRYGKTDMAGVMFPAIGFGLAPDSEFILASYSKEKATETSQKIRDLMQTPAYKKMFPTAIVRGDSKAKDEFRTTEGGVFYAAGVGTGIAGWGAGKTRSGFGGAFIIDDPINPTAITSQAEMDSVINWYRENVELGQRLNAGLKTPIIVIMQRLAVNDLVGYLMDNDKAHDWHVLSIPAITEDGRAIYPQRHSIEDLRNMEKQNPFVFSSQFLQRPMVKGGNKFKREMFEFVDLPSEFDFTFSISDTATKDGEENDYTVFTDYGVKDGQLYIIAVYREKINAKDIETALRPRIERAATYWGYRKAWIEPKMHGIYLNQKFLVEGLPVANDSELKEFFKDRKYSKTERAENALAQLGNRKIYINKAIAIKDELVTEALQFPKGAHDDFVDTLIDGIKKAYTIDAPPQVFWI